MKLNQVGHDPVLYLIDSDEGLQIGMVLEVEDQRWPLPVWEAIIGTPGDAHPVGRCLTRQRAAKLVEEVASAKQFVELAIWRGQTGILVE